MTCHHMVYHLHVMLLPTSIRLAWMNMLPSPLDVSNEVCRTAVWPAQMSLNGHIVMLICLTYEFYGA